MIIINRKGELKVCVHCQVDYDLDQHKPRCFMPCGHTFCEKCIKNLMTKRKCSTCKHIISQHIPDYEMIDMIKEKQNVRKMNFNYEKLHFLTRDLLDLMDRGSNNEQLESIVSIRKLLSLQDNPQSIQEVIDVGVVEKLVDFLDSLDSKTQFEACWALTNVVSGTLVQTNYVIKAGAVPKLVNLVDSWNVEVCEQAIWALANIAGENAELRDLVLDNGILPPIKKALVRFAKDFNIKRKFQENAMWMLSNLCRGKPQVCMEKIEPAIEIFEEYIYHGEVACLEYTCWALSYLTDGANDRIQKIIDRFNMARFVELLSHEADKIVKPAVRICGNIVSGNDSQTQVILDCDLIKSLKVLAESKNKTIRKEVFWAASNIAAGSESQLQLLIDSDMFIIAKEKVKDEDPKVQKEIGWIFLNALETISSDQLKYIFDLKVFDILCDMLKWVDASIFTRNLLRSLQILLEYDNQNNQNKLARYVMNERNNCMAYPQIEELLNSKDPSICEAAQNLIDVLNVELNDD